MAQKKEIYKEIFEVYEFGKEINDNLHGIRRYIRDEMIRTYPNKEWSELSRFEKNRFIYIIIRAKMFEFIDASKHNRLNLKIDRFIDMNMLKVDDSIHEYNDILSNASNIFYCEGDTSDKMRMNYNKFCSALEKYNNMVPIPSYEEWLEWNKKGPIRVLDYCHSYYIENQSIDNPDKIKVSQTEIDHIALQTLLKVIEKKLSIKIDMELIDETISYIKNYHIEEDEPFFQEYDSSLNLSQEEFDVIKKSDQKYVYYKKKLEELDFIK